ncbi:hypothetical protein ASPWEDRAFT_40516 [Aspergillus wentii DTO 134E9]|uniref:Uncharacterized protein n=1 Tax=Aspergillus wentii DTO 134E9 TaxID=1073089 RepID=A0A1L9RKD2_ASPWE|nr:uncharacterized protein ASPWEDRAFT_40516 [Aspergillus wentii DTO 134E9]KAI9923477.1 hypothetical protein MW887_008638 [Aspergillus wentii]OJJ35308.1 hypothetical protein ASPWEDRAFT_40516 [Aspergillus wentii DTO 134E9]
MHCQQPLLAYLYTILSVANKNKNGFSPNTQEHSNVLESVLGYTNSLPDALKHIVASDIQNLKGPECTLSFNCPLEWPVGPENTLTENIIHGSHANDRPETTWNVTLTLSIFDEKETGYWQCKDRLEELLIRGQKALDQSPDLKKQHHFKQGGFHKSRPTPITHRQSDQAEMESLSQTYRGLFDSLLSSFQRRVVQKAANIVREGRLRLRRQLKLPLDQNISVNSLREQSRNLLKRCPYIHLTKCVETVCNEKKIERICGPKGKSRPGKKDDNFCRVCYPRKNDFLAREYCEKIRALELEVFYASCALLVITVSVAIILYLLRGLCKRVKKRCQPFRNLRGDQIPRSPMARTKVGSSVFSMDSIPASVPGILFKSGMDNLRRERNTAVSDEDNSEATPSMLRRKLNQLGLFMKDSRRKVQDVFDLESLSKRDEESSTNVPVLPRASNANIRRQADRKKRTDKESYKDDSQEC